MFELRRRRVHGPLQDGGDRIVWTLAKQFFARRRTPRVLGTHIGKYSPSQVDYIIELLDDPEAEVSCFLVSCVHPRFYFSVMKREGRFHAVLSEQTGGDPHCTDALILKIEENIGTSAIRKGDSPVFVLDRADTFHRLLRIVFESGARASSQTDLYLEGSLSELMKPN